MSDKVVTIRPHTYRVTVDVTLDLTKLRKIWYADVDAVPNWLKELLIEQMDNIADANKEILHYGEIEVEDSGV